MEALLRKKVAQRISTRKSHICFYVCSFCLFLKFDFHVSLHTLPLFSVAQQSFFSSLVCCHPDGYSMRFRIHDHKCWHTYKISTKLILYGFQSTYILFIFDLISLSMLTFHSPSLPFWSLCIVVIFFTPCLISLFLRCDLLCRCLVRILTIPPIRLDGVHLDVQVRSRTHTRTYHSPSRMLYNTHDMIKRAHIRIANDPQTFFIITGFNHVYTVLPHSSHS